MDGSEHYLALTLPSPEHPLYAKVRTLAQKHDFILNDPTAVVAADRHKTLNFLANNGGACASTSARSSPRTLSATRRTCGPPP